MMSNVFGANSPVFIGFMFPGNFIGAWYLMDLSSFCLCLIEYDRFVKIEEKTLWWSNMMMILYWGGDDVIESQKVVKVLMQIFTW